MIKRGKRINITAAERSRISELVADGFSMEAVAREINRSVYAVQRVVYRQRNAVDIVPPWRCAGCGGLVTFTTCLSCRHKKIGRRGRQDTFRKIRSIFSRGRREGRTAYQVERALYDTR